MTKPNKLSIFLIITTNYLTKLARDIMVPAIPTIAIFYAASDTLAKQTVSWYFLGICCSRLVWPVLADHYHKRKLLVLMHLLFILATIGCSQQASLLTFSVGRFIQAFSIAAIPLLVRSLIYQQHGSDYSIKLYGYLSPLTAWSPAFAAALGSLLISYFALPALSWALVGFGVMSMLLTSQLSDQTVPQPKNRKLTTGLMFNGYITLLKDLRFWRIALPFALLAAGNALFLALAAYLLLKPGLLTLSQFALTSFVVMSGQVLGRVSAGKLVDHFKAQHMLLLAPMVALFFTVVGIALSLHSTQPAPTWLVLVIAGNYYAIGMTTVVAKGCIGDLVPSLATTSLGLMTWLESFCSFVLVMGASIITSSFAMFFSCLALQATVALLLSASNYCSSTTNASA